MGCKKGQETIPTQWQTSVSPSTLSHCAHRGIQNLYHTPDSYCQLPGVDK